jgi:hypothetical protein
LNLIEAISIRKRVVQNPRLSENKHIATIRSWVDEVTRPDRGLEGIEGRSAASVPAPGAVMPTRLNFHRTNP